MCIQWLKKTAKAFGTKQVLKYMNRDPETNIPKILNWLEKHDRGGSMTHQVQLVREAFNNKDSNWHKLVASLWTDIDDGMRLKLFETFLINVNIIGGPKQKETSLKNDCNVPWAILMDPTSACNLHCTGCWANEYGGKWNLTFEELDNIIQQGKAMGTYFYIFSGGEPTVRKDDIIRLCEKHQDCAFLAFTNGTLFDEAFADEMLRVKNFVPAISVEGFEEATDSRRGKGTYQKVIETMKLLQRKKLPFGLSLCYTSANTEVIGSDAYIDEMIKLGAKFAWFFTYIPVGADAVPELMATAEQRHYMYDTIRRWRKEKEIFTLDFWNDGEYAGGCIAGGRRYLHINANGDIEPCAFTHYSDSNIRQQTLLEALKRPLFMQYHKNQPFNKNMLMPCPLLDNYGKLAEMVDAAGDAKSTDQLNPEDVHDLCAKCKKASECWKPVADEIWAKTPPSARKPLRK
ncbi:MAG TPA: radical SAM protein [Candidatus Limiplasma sp.]|nr:radical SAM protein [Candidatus Limiplasma sp.]